MDAPVLSYFFSPTMPLECSTSLASPITEDHLHLLVASPGLCITSSSKLRYIY